MKTTDVDLSADTIDVRDIIARVEELEGERDNTTDVPWDANSSWGSGLWAEENPEDAEELATLESILADLKGNGGDEQWRGDWYPVTLIRDTYFEDYARELAEDIGAVNKEASWPANHIDWEAASNALLIDYTEVTIDGNEYYYR